ncbi:MAG: transketolase [Chlorobi bacterium]|nr:transketolase [Chlorobiota bacterium]
MDAEKPFANEQMDLEEFKRRVLEDYRLINISRQMSLTGRKEVLSGRGQFGIFGDGKELPQIAWAKVFKPGDFRSGYYRDQTFMMAIGKLTPEQFFAQVYGHPDLRYEPHSGGRQMNNHFATRLIDENKEWLPQAEMKNTVSDISPTGGQMPRLVGLAQASKLYRHLDLPEDYKRKFTRNGNEIAWGTIGNASTAEGLFWETVNAAGVLQVPVVISIWDDEYGISVHAKDQTTKQNISEILKGFQRDEKGEGFEIFTVKGWDYPALIETYEKAEKIAREEHVPVIIHVTELTQPQGHSTSGSHERYKSAERLEWERAHDGIVKMRQWILENNLADEAELDAIESEAKKIAKEAAKRAWAAYTAPMKEAKKELLPILAKVAKESHKKKEVEALALELAKLKEPKRRDISSAARRIRLITAGESIPSRAELEKWLEAWMADNSERYDSGLFTDDPRDPKVMQSVPPQYAPDAPMVDGRIILRDNFEKLFEKYPHLVAFGEDVGKIGDVNQGMEGLQKKFGELRIFDTGIRETTIIGQGIGLAVRGFRPIAEIQYLDYILFALQTISDDVATMHYRSAKQQMVPIIIRTRGHRLEGIWHSGSPMNGVHTLSKGIYILVPRDMTRAAGFYNTLMDLNNPALIVESLNGYRLKEKMPSNLGEFKVPIGVTETLREGTDITLVSYGSTLRLVMQAAEELAKLGIDSEVIDVQSLHPFDTPGDIAKSVKKTNKLVVIDEDVSGGATAYILDQIINKQGAWAYLDAQPLTIHAKDHRPAYAADGDYFSKPSVDDIMEGVYGVMHQYDPAKYPL